MDENPQDPGHDDISRRIAQLEFRRARQVDTIYAWRQFIAIHPGSPLVLDARRRLERLQFERASRQGNPQAWREFLRQWPEGRLADRARQQAAQWRCRQLADSTDEDTLAEALRRSLPCRRQLAERLERLRFRAAMERGSLPELYAFLERYPRGANSRLVRRRLLEQLVEALLAAARFDQALERVKSSGVGADDLVDKIRQERRWWQLTSFGDIGLPDSATATITAWRRELQRNRRWYRPLARDTRRLRQPAGRQNELDGVADARQARQRWLLASRLGRGGDEASADRLLRLAGDSYLEVRRRARQALQNLLATLGPARAMAWLHDRIMAIRDKAVGKMLLYRMALLQYLQRRPAEALASLQKIFEQEGMDLSSLALGIKLAHQLGQPRQAALLGRDFTRVALEFFENRWRAWQEEGLRHSDSGANVLWQLYGLVRTWKEVLDFFPVATDGAGKDYRVVLGNWLAKSRSGLARVSNWLARAQEWWSTRHPGWIPCEAEPAEATSTSRQDVAALLRLTFLPRGPTAATLRWVGCCYPDAKLRRRARLLRKQARLLRDAGLVIPVWQLPGLLVQRPGEADRGNAGTDHGG